MQDSQYKDLSFNPSLVDHKYGENIKILKDPYLHTLLSKISSEQVVQPILTRYIEKSYQGLFNAISSLSFPLKKQIVTTRMIDLHSEAKFETQIFDQDESFVVVDLARAGIIPAQLMYNELNYLYNPQNIRQDHFYVSRRTNDKNEVVGIDISGSKVGGDIDDKIVIFPDPMGATGGTISESISHYKKNVKGKAKKIITAHLIITPEYIQRIKKDHPDVEVYTIRLDRGLSSIKALDSIPGTFADEERGLNENQYIVPGAGGVGELLNNSYV